MNIKSINVTTVQETVYEELLKAILCGKIPPGEKITIEGIANMMNVSLTPVRVAVKKLEAGNFIKIGKNRRISIAEISHDNLVEIFKIRRLLECYAAEIACSSRSDDVVELLEKLNEKCEEAENSDEYLEANSKFHNLIYSQAKMPILESMITSLWQQVSPYLYILLREEHQRIIKDFDPNHRGMIEAMKNKDSLLMEKWLTKELTESEKLIAYKMQL